MNFPVWKEVVIGGVPKEEFLQPADVGVTERYPLGQFAKEMIQRDFFVMLPGRRRIYLARQVIGSLFGQSPTFEGLQDYIQYASCSLCPAETALHVHRQFQPCDMKNNTELLFVMDPIITQNGQKRIFKANKGRDCAQCWLHGMTIPPPPNDRLRLDYEVVFVIKSESVND